jgi:hypothetical protein
MLKIDGSYIRQTSYLLEVRYSNANKTFLRWHLNKIPKVM